MNPISDGMKMFSKLGDACLDFLFPKKSAVLGLESLSSGELLSVLAPAEDISEESIIAVFSYREPLVRDMVWELKYGGNRKIAEKLGEIVYDTICDELYEKNVLEEESSFILMPVPVSDKRRYERGWNQAELLAEAVKKRDKEKRFKYLPRQLSKFRHTESQTHTSGRDEREENIRNSMRVLNPAKVLGKRIILLDDVYTTGATLREAKRALKEAGAKEIICVAVAH
jgi:competence protein ComFC